MTLEEKIIASVKLLPGTKQAEILDFIEYLREKSMQQEASDWASLSLSSALRGMEDEVSPYSENDLTERF